MREADWAATMSIAVRNLFPAAIAGEVLGALGTYGIPATESALAAAESAPHTCWHNVGGHNWFEACARLADVEVRRRDRVLFRCATHAEVT